MNKSRPNERYSGMYFRESSMSPFVTFQGCEVLTQQYRELMKVPIQYKPHLKFLVHLVYSGSIVTGGHGEESIHFGGPF